MRLYRRCNLIAFLAILTSLLLPSPSWAQTTPTLTVTGAAAMSSSGKPGGPFSPNSFTYTIGSTGNPLNWSISSPGNILDVTATWGTTPATVTFTLDPSDTSLAAGTYKDLITFTNTTNGAGTTTRPA